MADEEQGTGSQWLLEPAQPDGVRILVEVGSEAQLTDDVRSSLERLARALQEQEQEMAEVSGFAMGGMQIGMSANAGLPASGMSAGDCKTFSCTVHWSLATRSGTMGTGARGGGA
ncbi:MAG: hypothetical protein M3066_08170 [Actinomycetota bacterium]|nr:hypothetical protein [Actinomycetota bacterium]